MRNIKKNTITTFGFVLLFIISIVIYINTIENKINQEVETGIQLYTEEQLQAWLYEFYETIPSATHLIATGDTRFANADDLRRPMSRSGPLEFRFFNSKGDITYRSTTGAINHEDHKTAKRNAAEVLRSGSPLITVTHDETHHAHNIHEQQDVTEPLNHEDDHHDHENTATSHTRDRTAQSPEQETHGTDPHNREEVLHAVADAFVPVTSENGQFIGVLNAKVDVSHVQQLMEKAFYEVSGLALIGTISMLLLPSLALALRTVQVMRSDKKLLELAKYDQTTGIYNRATALEILAKAFPMPRSRKGYGILFIDVDYFKSVNDTLGHRSGDLFLKHIASVLKNCIRQGKDTLARYGGDEFLIICPNINMHGLRKIYQRIEQAIQEPFEIDGKPQHISLSIGAYISEENDSKVSALHKADLAVYAAKHAGRGQTVEYSRALEKDTEYQEERRAHDARQSEEVSAKSA